MLKAAKAQFRSERASRGGGKASSSHGSRRRKRHANRNGSSSSDLVVKIHKNRFDPSSALGRVNKIIDSRAAEFQAPHFQSAAHQIIDNNARLADAEVELEDKRGGVTAKFKVTDWLTELVKESRPGSNFVSMITNLNRATGRAMKKIKQLCSGSFAEKRTLLACKVLRDEGMIDKAESFSSNSGPDSDGCDIAVTLPEGVRPSKRQRRLVLQVKAADKAQKPGFITGVNNLSFSDLVDRVWQSIEAAVLQPKQARFLT